MSIQASNAKIAVVVATLLAEVDAHGRLNGCDRDKKGLPGDDDDTPLSRQQYFSGYCGTQYHWNNNYVNGAENRVTRNIEMYKEGTENGWTNSTFAAWKDSENDHPELDQHPILPDAATDCADPLGWAIWLGTEADQSVRKVNGETVDSDNLGVCVNAQDPSAAPWDTNGKYLGDIMVTGNGCCGGWSDMSQFEQELTKGPDNTPTGKRTVCYTMDFYADFPTNSAAQHFGIPTYPDQQPDKSPKALNIDERQPVEERKVYTAGTSVDLSWVSTVMHGGMVEYSIVCDGDETDDRDETYASFKKNRLQFDKECTHDNGGCGMYKVPDTTFGDYIRANIISNDNYWAFVPESESDKVHSQVPANAGFRDRVKIPASLNTGTENKRCTLGWFWWGKNSAGVFTACSDIIIAPAVSPAPAVSRVGSN